MYHPDYVRINYLYLSVWMSWFQILTLFVTISVKLKYQEKLKQLEIDSAQMIIS